MRYLIMTQTQSCIYYTKRRGATKMKHEKFIELARNEVVRHLVSRGVEATIEDVYVVWSVKVVQNSKALLSTDLISGLYVEATLHGDKQEVYVDIYNKECKVTVDVSN